MPAPFRRRNPALEQSLADIGLADPWASPGALDAPMGDDGSLEMEWDERLRGGRGRRAFGSSGGAGGGGGALVNPRTAVPLASRPGRSAIQRRQASFMART